MAEPSRWAAWAARTVVALTLLGLAAASPEDADDDAAVDSSRFHRLSEFVRAYAARKGLSTMTDEDIKCLLQLGEAVKSDTHQHNALVQPAATLFGLVLHTTPRCKIRLVTKARMFLAVDFAKGAISILLNQDLNASTPS